MNYPPPHPEQHAFPVQPDGGPLQYAYPVHPGFVAAQYYGQGFQRFHPAGTVDAVGAFVKPRSSRRVLVLSILTLGLYGAFWHGWTNADLGQFGRARDRMPFPYIQVSQSWSCIAYIFGWLAALALWAQVLTFTFDGRAEGLSDWMGVASSAILAAPLWGSARATMQRIVTARMLVGIAEPTVSPGLVGVLAVLLPPWYAWQAQRSLSPVWDRFSAPVTAAQPLAQPPQQLLQQPMPIATPTTAVHEVLRPGDIAHEVEPAAGLLVGDDHMPPRPTQPEIAPLAPPAAQVGQPVTMFAPPAAPRTDSSFPREDQHE